MLLGLIVCASKSQSVNIKITPGVGPADLQHASEACVAYGRAHNENWLNEK
jgi:hypothetical protein